MLLLKKRKVLYTLHVHVPLKGCPHALFPLPREPGDEAKGTQKKGYDGVSLPGQPIYSRGIVWMVSCPCVTCSSAVRSAALISCSAYVKFYFWDDVIECEREVK